MVKNLHDNAGDSREVGLIPSLGRSPGVGNSNPLQYSCLENSMDRGVWWSTVHGVAKSWIQLSACAHTHTHTHTHRHTHYFILLQALPYLSFHCIFTWEWEKKWPEPYYREGKLRHREVACSHMAHEVQSRTQDFLPSTSTLSSKHMGSPRFEFSCFPAR